MSENKKQVQSKRPLSPHLSIYKPQISSVLSISHRITGVALFGGILLFAWWIVFNVYGCASCVNPLISSLVGKIFLFLWSVALYYHLLNGVRHLFWDIGKGLEKETARKSGIFVLFGTAALVIISWLLVA